jgi:hypothetical protein
MRLMKFPFAIRTRRQLLLSGYLFLAMWAALEWISDQHDHTIRSPLVFIPYMASFTACMLLSAVLYLYRPGKWLCQEKLASLLLLTPLVWNFF